MTGTIELSDQDIQDLTKALSTSIDLCRTFDNDSTADRLEDLKDRLLKVEVNES